jgi:hypothetical protein
MVCVVFVIIYSILKFDFYVTVHLNKFPIIIPTRCNNFSNLFLKWNSTCFGQFLCPSSGVFHCTHNNVTCHTGLLTACEQEEIPDDRQWNFPKHVEFHFKNKFGKLVHLIGIIIRNKEENSHFIWSLDLTCVSDFTHSNVCRG